MASGSAAVLPASWVAAGYGVPGCCSRHDREASEYRKIKLISKPPGWSYALLLVGALGFLVAVLVTQKSVTAPRWPFCADCARTSRVVRPIALVGLALGMVGIVFGAASAGRSGGPILFLAGWVVLLVAAVVAGRAHPRALSGAFVSADGMQVVVPKAQPQFGAQVAAAHHQAHQQAHQQAQMHAWQQAQARPQMGQPGGPQRF